MISWRCPASIRRTYLFHVSLNHILPAMFGFQNHFNSFTHRPLSTSEVCAIRRSLFYFLRRVSDRYLNELIQQINADLKPKKKKSAESGDKKKE